MTQITELRHELHAHPEISHQEYETSERIERFIQAFLPDEIIHLGKTGLAFVFQGKEPGRTVVFRSELDALPIVEQSELPYKSVNQGVAHSCGHDGHMAIVAGLAERIARERPRYGKVVLLYQPAEEVEQGAREVVEDPAFQDLHPDYVFALHNIPGFAKHHILLKSGSFAAASKGMTVRLTGKTSHAAEPENGISPANAIATMISRLHALVADKTRFSDYTLLTFIHILMGEISFGTSPGYAEVRMTLRSFRNDDMDILTARTEEIIREIAGQENLKCVINYGEVFPASVNNDECLAIARRSALQEGLEIETIEHPFKWSEDFGYYSGVYPTCLFGLGAGLTQPPLHNPDYNFPDEIIETGIRMFFGIYHEINLKNDR